MYRFTFEAESGVLIGGQTSSLTMDKVTAQRMDVGDKPPYLPASALKGAMRIEFERLLRSWQVPVQVPVCDGSNPKTMCRPTNEPCLACSLFGTFGRRPGKLRFHDAMLTSGWRPGSFEMRTGVSLSRALRRAQPQRLFDFEATPAGLKFEAFITVLEKLSPQEKDLFEKALGWWQQEGLSIGGSRSRGMGKLRLRVDPIQDETIKKPPTFSGQVDHRWLYLITFSPEGEPVRVSPPKPSPYFLRSYPFIPGSTIRGALAYALLREGMDERELGQLFLHDPPFFSHLYPGGFFLLPPATAVQCKKESRHGSFDLLAYQFLSKWGLKQGGRVNALERLHTVMENCPRCRSGLTAAEAFTDVTKHLFIKLALNRSLMRAEPGMFYIYETLWQRTAFQGVLWASQEQVDTLARKEPGKTFWSREGVLVGGARSKGFGRGSVQIAPLVTTELGHEGGVENRMEEFNKRLTSVAQALGLDDALAGRLFFTLNLMTDLALPAGQTLKEMLEPFGWQWETAALRWTKIGGFNEKSGVSKPLVSALERGGVVLLSVPQSEKQTVMRTLTRLETEGLGLLRDYGLGWVRTCHEFHYSAEVLHHASQ